MKRDLEIILERRKNKVNRKQDPLSNFWEKVYRGVLLVDFAENSRSRKIKSESRRQFIVILITAFEVYVADVISELIESNSIDIDKLTQLPKRDSSLKELSYIIKNNVKISEVICSAINFQNLEKVSKLLGEIFQIDFFNYLKCHKFEYLNKSDKWAAFTFNKNLEKNLEKLFYDRHSFVHDVSFRGVPSYEYLNSSRKLLIRFAFAIEILANKFRDNRSSKISKK